MKAILLAGGKGTRLFPATNNLSKQLLPVFDKPMFYYPLVTLMQARIRHVLLITMPEDRSIFERMLGNGHQFGMQIEYAEQETPNGIAKAFEIGKSFIGTDPVCLILGDNLFLGQSVPELLLNAKLRHAGATVFGYKVHDPERYGVVEFDAEQQVISVEEKPITPKSNIAVTGLYFYDNDVIEIAADLTPSERGEYEITSVNQMYLKKKRLKVELLEDDVNWFDAGTHESYLSATNYVAEMQRISSKILSCPEMIAYQNNWITRDELRQLIKHYPNNAYTDHLSKIIQDELSIF